MPKFYEATDEVGQNVIDTNFVGGDKLARRVAPLMIDQRWGRIINVTTMYRTMTRQGGGTYGPSKAALECASEIWHKDLEGTGVTVNILNPGAGAATPGMSDEMKERDKTLENPVLIEADLMKAPIVWLMSDATNEISGMRYDAKPWDPGNLPPMKPRVSVLKLAFSSTRCWITKLTQFAQSGPKSYIGPTILLTLIQVMISWTVFASPVLTKQALPDMGLDPAWIGMQPTILSPPRPSVR